MIGLIGYFIGCFFVAVVLTFLFALVRPIRKNDDLLSWRVMFVMFALTFFAPYGYVEMVTKMNGDGMEPTVRDVVTSVTNGNGKFDYYKVLSRKDENARVIAVFTEKSKWGGDERCSVAINLSQKQGKWTPVDFNWIMSDQRERDSVSLPPYW